MEIRESVYEKLQRRLIRDEQLPLAYTAILAAQALYQFVPEAQDAAKRWAEGESIADFKLAGVAVSDLQMQLGGTEFQALCILNAVENRRDAFKEAVLVNKYDTVELPENQTDSTLSGN